MRLPENHKYKSAQQENQSSFPNRKKKLGQRSKNNDLQQ